MKKLSAPLAGGLLAGLTFLLIFLPRQEDTFRLFSLYFPAFGVYLWLNLRLCRLEGQALKYWLWAALFMRLLLILPFPNLSDDIYRFIWDGHLWRAGLNPFDLLPSEIMATPPYPPGLDPALFKKLNSPGYYTVYPPLAQFSFWLSTSASPHSIYGSAVLMKLLLCLTEGITLLLLLPSLLKQYRLPPANVLWYALNPLVMIEVVGNLHFEGAMLCLLLAALLFLNRGQIWKSGMLWAGAIAVKLLPLMFLPLLLKTLGRRAATRHFMATGLTLLVLFFPLWNSNFLPNFADSLDLYFRTFEFNASIYYLSRWIGQQTLGYNPIAIVGPALSLITLGGILALAFLPAAQRQFSLPERMLLVLTLYLLLSTTVHPWYLVLLLGLMPLTRLRYPVVWSGLIILSYAHYFGGSFTEKYILIALEYLILFALLFWELRPYLNNQRMSPTKSQT